MTAKDGNTVPECGNSDDWQPGKPLAIVGLEMAVDLPALRREVGLARPRGLRADTGSCGGPANRSWITSVVDGFRIFLVV